ncbi:hypothetical protein Drorol1_Dr00014160 [Drosera rotundifolia]
MEVWYSPLLNRLYVYRRGGENRLNLPEFALCVVEIFHKLNVMEELRREEDGLANSRPAVENKKKLAVEGKAETATRAQKETGKTSAHVFILKVSFGLLLLHKRVISCMSDEKRS